VTQHRSASTGQNGSHAATVVRQGEVPDRVDALMNRMQATGFRSSPYRPLREAELAKLSVGDDAVLNPRQLGQ
jgi:hypothetical protein